MNASVVVWITGLPSSGKSTLARQLHAALGARGVPSCVLDGDAVRKSLVPSPGYSTPERKDFYETLARFAALLAAQGLVVLVPATAHLRAYREQARALAPAYVEVFVDTPLAECELRDSKGLYRKSRAGDAPNMPGSSEDYEPPEDPDFTCQGLLDPAALARFLALLATVRGTERAGRP
jgi:adenylylsulfate kinase